MIIPIRCMTCGNMIASKWKKYQEELSTGTSNARSNLITNDIDDLKEPTVEYKALEAVEVSRYCCRRHLLSHTDIIDII
jgi:DNA-directed RNA polymerase subunit N